MRVALVGRSEVTDDAGAPVDVGGAQPRTGLAVLPAAGGRPVTTEGLVDARWGGPPPSAVDTLHGAEELARARGALGAARRMAARLSELPG